MSTNDRQAQCASISCSRLSNLFKTTAAIEPTPKSQCRKRSPTVDRLERSRTEVPIFQLDRYVADVANGHDEKKDSVLYLAYGSNLSFETFQGKRKVRPLAQVNVVVPELRMTFDLPGIPYAEPCFANTARRDPTDKPNPPPTTSDYHKDRWKKGLVGVVYEVTPSDYAHIIATEGGGSSYQDVLVDCYVLEAGVNTVPEVPTGTPFKAHTLFAPYSPPDESKGGRQGRPDPSYAQASARYLKLISGGAREHCIPKEYQDYLDDLRPYTITTQAQRVGQFVFATLWLPFVVLFFGLTRVFQDKKTGLIPPWLAWLGGQLFGAVWRSYDGIFKRYFGDGERTIGDGQDDAFSKTRTRSSIRRSISGWKGSVAVADDEVAEKLIDL